VKCDKEGKVLRSASINKASDALHSKRAAGLMKVFGVHHVIYISYWLKHGEGNLLSDSEMRTFFVGKGMMERVG
jgi:hypothetical protein